MTTTINDESRTAHSRRVLANEDDVFSSFNVEDFAISHDKNEEWKFILLRKLHGLHNGATADPVTASISVETAGQGGVAVGIVKRDGERLDHADTPTDRVATQAYSDFDDAHVVTFVKNSVSKEPVIIDVGGPGEGSVSYDYIVIDVQSHTGAVCVIDYRGSDTFTDNIEFTIGDGAKLSVVTMVNWNEDAVYGSAYHIRVSRDATLRHTIVTFGSEIVRIVSRAAFTAPGDDIDLLGVYFTDADQYLENRMLVDHAVPNYHSSVVYKGALQGEPNVAHREARTVWVGGVLTRAETTGIDVYELNRNLLLTEGARTSAVLNLGVETGEIAGAGHAATVSRFDEEQLFYLLSRDIPKLAARRLVVHGFFNEVTNLIPVEPVCGKLEKLVGEELNTADF